ncbi:unnamed protein product [Darwinula stevensoni]|uniref:Heat shock protein 70 n=1 Tax=Darwinula stevensoni TaxID=69355 RepID=A0A7R9AFP4_9CRUS|nr:unnamed protein product [Darwinula stevensoni]CAG0903209.1 unnamed protein product [Darwinula stevensoni]
MHISPINSDFEVQQPLHKSMWKCLKSVKFDPVFLDLFKVSYKREAKTFCPEEINSMLLSKMKELAAAYLGRDRKEVIDAGEAVVTVPASFNSAQRQATIDSGKIAGFRKVHIINEPTAAAIACCFKKVSKERNFLIFDLGGGTLDISIVTYNNGIYCVKYTAGRSDLGGEDFDNNIMCHLVEKVFKRDKEGLKKDKQALLRLRAACVNAKHVLSSSTKASIVIGDLFEKTPINTSITRTEFEQWNNNHLSSIRLLLEKVKEHAESENIHINEIVLVGGSIRIPAVQDILKECFEDKVLNMTLNPEEAVACGASIYVS